MRHVHAQVVRLLLRLRAPELTQDLAMRQDLARDAGAKGAGTRISLAVRISPRPPARVTAWRVKSTSTSPRRTMLTSVAGCARRSSTRTPREQFTAAEWLGEVVVRAGVEHRDLVRLAAPH